MDRETAAQAIAMLVMLAALARWLPRGEEGDSFGRGDPWRALAIDQSLLDEPPGSHDGAAALRAMFRRDGSIARWTGLLEQVARLQARTGDGDVIQIRGVSRNEFWTLAYDLYPAHVVGRTVEEGGSSRDAVLPEAHWVLTLVGPKATAALERGPAPENSARAGTTPDGTTPAGTTPEETGRSGGASGESDSVGSKHAEPPR